MVTPGRRRVMVGLGAALAVAACGCAKSSDDGARVGAEPALWEPIDADFKSCEGGCGTRATGTSAGVKAQPGVAPGDRTYCPVSGVVFQVTEASARREVGGRPVFFCCEKCAAYFSAHAGQVIAARGLSAPR
jgi:YHS domain-containing protein